MRAWREVCEQMQQAHEQAELMAVRAGEKAQRRVLVAWLARVRADGHARQLLLQAHMRRGQHAVLLAACAAWRAFTSEPTVWSPLESVRVKMGLACGGYNAFYDAARKLL